MNNPAKTKNISDVIMSCYTDNARKYSHMVRFHSLVYVFSGELLLEERGKQTSIRAGECVFIRRDHRVKMIKQPLGDEQFRAIWFTFQRNALREYFGKMTDREIPQNPSQIELSVMKITHRPELDSLFQSLTPYFDNDMEPLEEVIKMKEQEALLYLLNMDERFYRCLFDFTEPWKIDLMEFMENNYMYELSLEDIASFTGRSLATFKRDFARLSDLSPQKWIVRKRLEAAYTKIKEEGKKPSEVYSEVGFKNRTHFYNAFKRKYGFSPGN